MSRLATRILLRGFLGVAVLATSAVPGLAARSGKTQEKTFEGKARVVAVEVPVNVVDRDGEPVRGLTADDFELLDEGKEQAISGFEVVDLAQIPAQAESAAPALPPAARRHLLLLFDISFSNPAAVLKARLAAREFVLQHLHPTDLVAVATYSLETGPRLVVTFTPDRVQVAHAIDSLGEHFTAELDPLRFIVLPTTRPGQDSSTSISQSQRPGLTDGGARGAYLESLQVLSEQMDRTERSFKASQVTSFARSLGEMAHMLAAVQGRKHVVFFSEGFDSRLLTGDPLSDVSSGGDDRAFQIQTGDLWRVDSDDLYGNTGLQRKLRDMVQEFRRADCVIQAVDIGGLRAAGNIRTDTPLNVGHEGLFYMANETGGELFKDANDLEDQLQAVLERNSVTYVLSFEPSPLAFDGRFHRLKVKLKDPAESRLRVSFRQGYYEPRPFPELHPLEKDLLAADAIASAVDSKEIDIGVLAAPFRATADWAYVPVIVEVDGKTLLAGHQGKQATVEIYTYATTDEGQMQGFFSDRLTVDLAKGGELLAAKGLKYYGHLELAPGAYHLRVLVRNADTGHTAVTAVPLLVPTYDQQPAVVLPPFFLEEPGRWLMVRERPRDHQANSTVYPFTVNGQPYVPAARPELRRNEDARLCLVAYNVGDGDVTLQGQVTTADGQRVEGGSLRLVERTATGIDGYDKFLASFRPSGLVAGDYRLLVALTDPKTGRTENNSIPFSVFN
jgi:VWFA-related protein